MSKYYQPPPAAVPVCISDLDHLPTTLDLVDNDNDGGVRIRNIRVVGRMSHYDPVREYLQLTEPPKKTNTRLTTTAMGRQESSSWESSSLLVDTSLIGFEFNCRKGSQILCVGELQTWDHSRFAGDDTDQEKEEGLEQDSSIHHRHKGTTDQVQVNNEDNRLVLRATICKPIEGLDYDKYCQYVQVIGQRAETKT